MNHRATPNAVVGNQLLLKYPDQTGVILFAHGLIGTVRGKTANGLMIHGKLLRVLAIVDKKACGKSTSDICQGVNKDIPVYADLYSAIKEHNEQVRALVLLTPPEPRWNHDLELAVKSGMDIINTSMKFISELEGLCSLIKKQGTAYFDLRNVVNIKAYPNIKILERKAKVVYVTGTDCGLGKRTASVELVKEAKRRGINAVMYATGQTGLMLGEQGTVVDSLILEFSNGVVSQHIYQFDQLGYELIIVEGQSDVFHPANSAVAISLLHGSNPDCVILVHDEDRKVHKGFEEDSALYKMHPAKRYIEALKMMSLPCGPEYNTVGIATIGQENIDELKGMEGIKGIPVADVLLGKGSEILLDAILEHCEIKQSTIYQN